MYESGIERKFETWKARDKNSDFYQGEVNEKGLRDGKGIYIKPGVCVGIGYMLADKLHGKFIWFFADGNKVSGTWKHGKTHGLLKTVGANGKNPVTEVWKDGSYVGIVEPKKHIK